MTNPEFKIIKFDLSNFRQAVGASAPPNFYTLQLVNLKHLMREFSSGKSRNNEGADALVDITAKIYKKAVPLEFMFPLIGLNFNFFFKELKKRVTDIDIVALPSVEEALTKPKDKNARTHYHFLVGETEEAVKKSFEQLVKTINSLLKPAKKATPTSNIFDNSKFLN